MEVGKGEISGRVWVGEEEVNKKQKGKNWGVINENDGAGGQMDSVFVWVVAQGGRGATQPFYIFNIVTLAY